MSLASLKPNLKTSQIASGRKYEYLDVAAAGEKTKGTLLLLHGFPDSWFGWRKQIQPWANRGYRIIAPSALGYGGTDKPTDPAEYTWKKLTDDIDALLDVVLGKDEKVFIVSHDWGAFTGWRFTQWHGDRVKAFCSVSIPFIPAPARDAPYYPIEIVAQKVPALSYQVYFNEPTAAQDLDDNRERFLDILYQTPENLMKAGLGQPGGFKKAVQGSDPVEKSPFWNDEERAFYNDYFRTNGFKAPLQFYQSNKPKHEEETMTPPPDLPEGVPKLFVHPTYDSVAIPDLVEKTGKIPNTTIVRVEKAGHWLLQGPEAAEVESKVGDWLDSVAAGAKL